MHRNLLRAPGRYTHSVAPTRVVRLLDERGAVRWGVAPSDTPKAGDVVDEVGSIADDDGSVNLTGARATIKKLLAPLPVWPPPAVFALGLNFACHAREVKLPHPRFPIPFLLNPASIVGPDDDVMVPRCAQEPLEVDFEAELTVVIGHQRCKDVSAEEALDYVCGYTVANDVSARRWQGKKGGGQWSRAKSFDTFTPVGPALLLGGGTSVADRAIRCEVNGVAHQDGSTRDMIFSVEELVSFLSQGTTLLPGSIILTGTPAGVGFVRDPPVYLRHGDVVEASVSGIGALRSRIQFEAVETPSDPTGHATADSVFDGDRRVHVPAATARWFGN